MFDKELDDLYKIIIALHQMKVNYKVKGSITLMGHFHLSEACSVLLLLQYLVIASATFQVLF